MRIISSTLWDKRYCHIVEEPGGAVIVRDGVEYKYQEHASLVQYYVDNNYWQVYSTCPRCGLSESSEVEGGW